MAHRPSCILTPSCPPMHPFSLRVDVLPRPSSTGSSTYSTVSSSASDGFASSVHSSPATSPRLVAITNYNHNLSVFMKVAFTVSREVEDERDREQLIELLLHGIAHYGKGSLTENDERLLPLYTLLVRHSRSHVSRGLVFRRLFEEDLFHTSVIFYRDWIEALRSESRVEEAEEVAELAREHTADCSLIDNMGEAAASIADVAFDLRERIMKRLADKSCDLSSTLTDAASADSVHTFTAAELYYIFSTTKMSEFLLYMDAATAPPSDLPIISKRIAEVRQLSKAVADKLREEDKSVIETLSE